MLANLPYVSDGAPLAPEIARWEPPGALFAGADGLRLIRRLVAAVSALGAQRPRLLALEIGPEQADEVAELVAQAGFGDGGALWPISPARAGRGRAVVSAAVDAAGLSAACRSEAWPCSRPTLSTAWPAMSHSRVAVERLYRLKRRRLDKPSAVMFFDLALALAALPELGPRTRDRAGAAAAGRRHGAAAKPRVGASSWRAGEDQLTLGLRVPVVPGLEAVRWPVLQSSANLAGGPDARALDDVPLSIRRAADMLIDGGQLPGPPRR